jgi:hypothetical protein
MGTAYALMNCRLRQKVVEADDQDQRLSEPSPVLGPGGRDGSRCQEPERWKSAGVVVGRDDDFKRGRVVLKGERVEAAGKRAPSTVVTTTDSMPFRSLSDAASTAS